MEAEEFVEFIGSFEGVETVVASAEGGAPETAWGDVFFSIAGRRQPFATIVKSDYPGFDETSQLDRDGVYRLNLAIGRDELRERFGADEAVDPTALDVLFPHPVYGNQGWISVLNPASSATESQRLARLAYLRAKP